MTCHENFSYATDAIHYEAAAYLTKPFDLPIMELNLQNHKQTYPKEKPTKTASMISLWRKILGLSSQIFGSSYLVGFSNKRDFPGNI